MSFRSISDLSSSPIGRVITRTESLCEPGRSGSYFLRLRVPHTEGYALVDQIDREIEKAEQQAGKRLYPKLPWEASNLRLILETRGIDFLFTTKLKPKVEPLLVEDVRGRLAQARYRIIVYPNGNLEEPRVTLRLISVTILDEGLNDTRSSTAASRALGGVDDPIACRRRRVPAHR